MRVAIDEQIFLLQKSGGASRYFVELMKAFGDDSSNIDCVTPYRRVWNAHAVELMADKRFEFGPNIAAPYPLLVAAAIRPRRPQSSADVVHHTFYHPRFLRDYPGRPKVVTIFDMIPELLGDKSRFGKNPHMAKREYVERADRVIFISESAKRDMIEVYGPISTPTEVIHLGVDPSFAQGGPPPPGFPKDYILFVGRRSGYKDFATALQAFREIAGKYQELHLVCIGGGQFTESEVQAFETYSLTSRIHQFSLADDFLPGAYANSLLFVFPSRYEGFGLPTLEAMAAGTPAILARTPALVEVGGDAGLYFDVGQEAELAGVMDGLLVDSKLQTSVVEIGKARAAQFSWQVVAGKTADVYHSLQS